MSARMLFGMTKPKPTPPINLNRYDPYKTYRFAEAPDGVETSADKKAAEKTAGKTAKKSPAKK